MLDKVLSVSALSFFCLSLTTAQGLHAAENSSSSPASETDNSPLTSMEKALEKLDFIPDVVAIVGEKPISGNQVKTMLLPELNARIHSDAPLPEKDEMRRIVFHATHRLIDQELLFKNCRETGYTPALTEVRKKMDNLEERLGEARFEELLQQQKLSRNEFLEQTANTLALNQWMEKEVFPEIDIDDEEIEKFYENNREQIVEQEKVEVSHILFSVSNWADEEKAQEAERKAEQLARQLEGNKNMFSEAANEHSDCPSGRQGGRLPPFSRGEMVPEFEKAAFNAEPGKVKGPVKTDFGFHLILVHEHYSEQQLSYEEAKEEVKRLLKKRQVNQVIEEVIERQREETTTEILFDP